MILKIKIGRKEYEITTDHAASSYDMPVVLVNGELVDLQVSYERDPVQRVDVLDALADADNVHNGPVTRGRLHDLASEMLSDIAKPTAADYGRVIATFKARGREMAAAE